MITESQEKKYIENKGLRCPHCNSNDLDTGCPNADGDVVTIEVTCKKCGEEWKDLYTLTGILQE